MKPLFFPDLFAILCLSLDWGNLLTSESTYLVTSSLIGFLVSFYMLGLVGDIRSSPIGWRICSPWNRVFISCSGSGIGIFCMLGLGVLAHLRLVWVFALLGIGIRSPMIRGIWSAWIGVFFLSLLYSPTCSF